jgi:hypothetical protein
MLNAAIGPDQPLVPPTLFPGPVHNLNKFLWNASNTAHGYKVQKHPNGISIKYLIIMIHK